MSAARGKFQVQQKGRAVSVLYLVSISQSWALYHSFVTYRRNVKVVTHLLRYIFCQISFLGTEFTSCKSPGPNGLQFTDAACRAQETKGQRWLCLLSWPAPTVKLVWSSKILVLLWPSGGGEHILSQSPDGLLLHWVAHKRFHAVKEKYSTLLNSSSFFCCHGMFSPTNIVAHNIRYQYTSFQLCMHLQYYVAAERKIRTYCKKFDKINEMQLSKTLLWCAPHFGPGT